jgi:hypothetical protein
VANETHLEPDPVFGALLQTLTNHKVEFIIVGGVAAAIHGGAHATYDVDVVYRRTPDNLARVVNALGDIDLLGEIVGGGSHEDLDALAELEAIAEELARRDSSS